MKQSIKQHDKALELNKRLSALYKFLVSKDDNETAAKVKELGQKFTAREFSIAMCGHFSAGKSSLINTLLGEKLLPSSPIPTSANLVKVRSGEDYAKVHFINEPPRLYLAPYDFDLVKGFCKDGDQIKEIEISHSASALPPDTMILDTPGIDSADDAHRIATEAAIHLADIVFYVMDYNHVQSELNFLFTRELTEAGKELYLVINQIDKHRDNELSFEEFKNSVETSFGGWGVRPARIFFTSLRNMEHSSNQFEELQKFIQERLRLKDEFLAESVSHSLKKLAYAHLNKMKETTAEEERGALEILQDMTSEEKQVILQQKRDLAEQKEKLKTRAPLSRKTLEEELENILKNAYLMPFQTRALAEEFLQSCQPDFKVGMFFSKAKTLSEKSERLDRFYTELMDTVKSQLQWHIKENLITFMKRNDLNDPVVLKHAQDFTIPFEKEELKNSVKAGALLSGEYVLNYTEDVSNRIKKSAREQLAVISEEMEGALGEGAKKAAVRLDAELEPITKISEAIEKIEEIQTWRQFRSDEVHALLYNEIKNAEEVSFIREEENVEIIKDSGVQTTISHHVTPVEEDMLDTNDTQGENHLILEETVSKLKTASSLINDIPGFKKLSLELISRAERLGNKGFTVALFGAFSAGKSSFANALMGENILPVSPNPTTAAINKIKPVTESHPHGQVLVKLKNSETILEDVNRSLGFFEAKANSLTEALEKSGHLLSNTESADVNERVHYAFLSAFQKGFAAVQANLGREIVTDLAEFQDYVALEEKSCFVDNIELYFDCALTRKGITLVDTPGADSINARHTGVAFDYIKNSDAILFVTYYNHAFSRADREFLIQLGRVKDSFQLDKMFFIINAIDLADGEEEQKTVMAYVREQLLKYGIRRPHLYPLSSLNALKEKTIGEDLRSGMPLFETAFFDFIANDLMQMTISSSVQELKRVYNRVERLIQSANEDQQDQELKKTKLEAEKAELLKILSRSAGEFLTGRILQETDELVHYIKQRVFFRFSDFFKEAFNPALIKDDGRNLKKALQSALSDLLASTGYDFAQEMRATTVRLDGFSRRILEEHYKGLADEMRAGNKELSFPFYDWNKHNDLEFETAFTGFNPDLFAKALSQFKNPKSFFEKNEKKTMSDEIQSILEQKADQYLEKEKQKISDFYTSLMRNEEEIIKRELAMHVEEFYESWMAMLSDSLAVNDLSSIQQKLEEVI